MVFVRGAFLAASGSYGPYRPALRAGAATAEQLPIHGLASHCPTGRGARSANGGFSRSLLYRVNQPATIISSDRPFVRSACRPIGDPPARPTTPTWVERVR